ncbi:Nodulation protein 10 [Mycobacteroides abscessus]|nr:Nodulation protein 10 [Mycobacteroides abscessus]
MTKAGAIGPARGLTLGQVFDPRNNALNAWRLALAVSVIFWHSWPLTGRTITYRPFEQLIEQVGVDGFFAVSGFLITASWLRKPKLRDFAIARGLRIFPGLWVCLAIIAFVIAPASVLIQGGSVSDLFASHKPIEYVINNGLLNVYYAGVDGTPRGVPWPGVWNGSIWTLVFEMICYIAVAVLGVAGLLKRRWVVPAAFVFFLAATAYLSYPVFAATSIPQMVARFAVMFAAGALLNQYKDVLPARWSLVALSVAIVLASGLLENYRDVAALPLAYAVIVSGPKLRDFAIARGLRIFPGLWVCLAIIAFVIAPTSVLIQGGSVSDLFASHKPIEYVINNGLLNVYYAGVDGTPRGVPWPGVWNGSIWTLVFEMICYIAVAVLGVAGLLKRRWVVPAAFVFFLAATAYLSYPVFAATSIPQMVARFAVMFAAGALLNQYKDVLPARWSLVALSVAIVLASGLLENYRDVAALPLAYAVIVSGSLIHKPRLNLRNDLSYGTYIYAYPIQQLLVVSGLGSLNLLLFFVIATAATVPLAAFSWFVVEKRAIALKSRLTRKQTVTVAERPPIPLDRDAA